MQGAGGDSSRNERKGIFQGQIMCDFVDEAEGPEFIGVFIGEFIGVRKKGVKDFSDGLSGTEIKACDSR